MHTWLILHFIQGMQVRALIFGFWAWKLLTNETRCKMLVKVNIFNPSPKIKALIYRTLSVIE